jgi:hypothetical protein
VSLTTVSDSPEDVRECFGDHFDLKLSTQDVGATA